IEPSIGFLQEERSAWLVHQVAYPEPDSAGCSELVELAGALELLPAVEITDAAVVVVTEVVDAIAVVIVGVGRIGLGVERHSELVADPDSRVAAVAEQRLLERLLDGGLAQLPDTGLEQPTQQELLAIRAREVAA